MRTMAKMICAFALVIVISVVVNTLSWSSLSFQQTANGWTVHTYEVLQGVDDMVVAMVDRETGVRGYLLAGDEGFLSPYKAGSENYQKAFNQVVRLTSDNATQQKRLIELDALVKGWTEEVAAKEIALMKDPATIEQARAMETAGAGKKWMDGVRAKAAEIAGDEAALLSQRSTAAVEAANGARTTILMGAAAMIAAVVLLLVLLQKSLIAPLVRIAGSMRVLAEGNTSIGIPGIGRKDEVGEMATAVEVFRQNAIANRKLEEEAAAARGHRRVSQTSAAFRKKLKSSASRPRRWAMACNVLPKVTSPSSSPKPSRKITNPFAKTSTPRFSSSR
jgi:methyl-accepting chemotaxis protein